MKADNEYISKPISKSEVKRLINEEKENIIQEVKESQKMNLKKEISGKLEDKLEDYEKRISTKLESSYQENFEAIKFLSDKVRQCLDKSSNIPNYNNEIRNMKDKINEITNNLGNKSRRSFIGTERSENDSIWEKVDSKLDKMFEFQQKIGDSHSNIKEKKQAYHKFGDEIVGLVKNIIKRNKEGKENEVKDFNNVISCISNRLKKYQSREKDDSDRFNDSAVSPEVFGKVMDRMAELVQKWNRYEDKGMTQDGTDKDRMITESRIKSSGDKHYIDDVSHVWTSRFNELADEMSEIKNSTQTEFNNVNQTLEVVQNNMSSWKNSETQLITMTEENIQSKFEYFGNNISEIYSLMDILKRKVKDKTQSKNNEVIFARLNCYGKNIKSLKELYKRIKEINSFCKKTIVDVSIVVEINVYLDE